MKYAVVEIAGKQYRLEPNKELLVNYLGDIKLYECERVLLKVLEDKVMVGKPYLKEKLIFDVIGQIKSKKIRVATYHAKANTRKVIGSRQISTKIRLKQAKVA